MRVVTIFVFFLEKTVCIAFNGTCESCSGPEEKDCTLLSGCTAGYSDVNTTADDGCEEGAPFFCFFSKLTLDCIPIPSRPLHPLFFGRPHRLRVPDQRVWFDFENSVVLV